MVAALAVPLGSQSLIIVHYSSKITKVSIIILHRLFNAPLQASAMRTQRNRTERRLYVPSALLLSPRSIL